MEAEREEGEERELEKERTNDSTCVVSLVEREKERMKCEPSDPSNRQKQTFSVPQMNQMCERVCFSLRIREHPHKPENTRETPENTHEE